MRMTRASKIDAGGKATRTVLWIDDSETTLLLGRAVLESVGYHVLTALNAWQGLNLLNALQVNAVIVDYQMPEMDGARLAMEIRRRKLALPIVMVSGCVAFPGAALRCVDRFVSKGDGPRALIECLQSLIPEIPAQPSGDIGGDRGNMLSA